jgi:hypothetical protein
MAQKISNIGSTLNVSINEISRFSYLINYDFIIFLDLYRLFVNNNLPLIISFYTNTNTPPDQYSFSYLKKLTAECITVDNLIKTNLPILTDMTCWEILDFFEDVKIKLATYNNLAKWTRSTKTVTGWGQTAAQIPYQLGNYETLEQVSGSLNGTATEQDDWQQIALDNNLTEIEYTTAGGITINITKNAINTPNLFLNSVIDSLSGVKMYGLDLDKKLSFVDNDFNIKSYNDTVLQSFKILLTLKSGDVPEFPNFGMNVMIGSNTMTFYYVSLSNQLKNNFASDDSLQNFAVKNIYYSNGDLYVNASVNTFYNLSLSNNQPIKVN